MKSFKLLIAMLPVLMSLSATAAPIIDHSLRTGETSFVLGGDGTGGEFRVWVEVRYEPAHTRILEMGTDLSSILKELAHRVLAKSIGEGNPPTEYIRASRDIRGRNVFIKGVPVQISLQDALGLTDAQAECLQKDLRDQEFDLEVKFSNFAYTLKGGIGLLEVSGQGITLAEALINALN